MSKELIWAIAKRIVRAFISGAIAGIVAIPLFSDFTEEKVKAYILLVISAAISGGLMGIDKAVRWTDEK